MTALDLRRDYTRRVGISLPKPPRDDDGFPPPAAPVAMPPRLAA